jgi:hypothetical protein
MNDSNDEAKSEDSIVNQFEKILKEKFGNPDFGGLMNSIVDQMLNDLAKKDEDKKE